MASSVGAGLAGLMLAYAVVRTGSVWMAAGLHAGWNSITSGVFFNRAMVQVTLDGERVRSFDAVEGSWFGLLCTAASVVAVLGVLRQGWVDDRKR